jgi:ribonuclease J
MVKQETSLTFYGGINEIGGNKILLEDKGIRIFLDFGQPFTMGEDYFTSWLQPRAINGLGDYFEFNLLPKIEGIYDEKQLRFTDLHYTGPQIDAVFLSHAHMDHIGHIIFLDEKIPIHCGEGTKLFIKALEETSPGANCGKHPYETFRTGQKIVLDHLEIEPIHVDHSIPACYGFIIHTSSGALVYTGDLRVHGPRGDMTEEFMEIARESEPVAMVSEGTRMVEVERRKNYSEAEVEELSDKIVSGTKKLVCITHYGRDMDRFRTFYKVAKGNGRKLVISPKKAYLLDKLVYDERLDLPNPLKDDSILVYFRRKKSGCCSEKDYLRWERKFMNKMVNFEFVHEHQSEIVMDLDFFQFTELVDIRPDSSSHFIHSMSEPYSEEDIKADVMHNWLGHFKIKFHQLHASGHMNRLQLTELINRIQPKWLFPVHTENPNLFKKIHENVCCARYGETYTL